MKFRAGFRLTLFVVIFSPILILAGFWQLERGEQKLMLKRAFDYQITQPPEALESLTPAAFATVEFTGEYAPGQYYLIDNAFHQGRVGYYVVHLVRTGVKEVLVNRGWIAAPENRADLPEITTPTGLRRFEGVLWPDMGLPLLLADDPWPDTWPKRVQRLNMARMAKELKIEFAWEIRLLSGTPGVLSAPRLIVEFGVERHYGYALQWFGLAVVLLVGFIIVGLRREP